MKHGRKDMVAGARKQWTARIVAETGYQEKTNPRNETMAFITKGLEGTAPGINNWWEWVVSVARNNQNII